MYTPLQMAYRSLNFVRAHQQANGPIMIYGKQTYHIRDKIKKLGGTWNHKKKAWFVDEVWKALEVGALFRLKVKVEAHCHEKEQIIWVTHEEAIAGVTRLGCGLCDCSFRCGDDVDIIDIYNDNLFREIKEYLSKGEDKMGKDEFAVNEAFENVLLPATREALERGAKYYKTTWLEHIDPNVSDFENVKHVLDVHVQYKIAKALVALDYGKIDEFVADLGSAVGYMANAVNKAKYLMEQEK